MKRKIFYKSGYTMGDPEFRQTEKDLLYMVSALKANIKHVEKLAYAELE